MTPDQFRRVRALFEELRGLPAGEWAARLEAACPDDPAVRQEVLDLLQQAAADFAAQRTAPSGGPRAESPPAADPLLGTSIGPYRIRGVLGQGGMGSVYEAEHERSKQVVALKLIRSGLATPALLRRFEFELQVLARLEHPGIARIYHADTADIGGGPQPYFAMELVRGHNLIQYATEQKLTIRQRLELAARIADAVQYAHQQGVIHRDLKPGNIFVTSAGQPKILDFGVARATDSDVQSTTLQTDIGQLIGTLPYMSPEQAAGDPNQIDTRSDVYALGVVIYELLTGRLPYLLERRLIHEVVRIIKEEEPTRLSSLNRTLRGDVETIVGKALEKERERRYASANALAADIRRYLNDEPIAARPPSATYQLGKFARRNKVLVGGVAATFLALTAGLATSIVLYQRAEAEAERATTAEARERGERERAETALAEVTKSRDETKQVADFQEGMLAQIDPTTAGYRLTEDVNRRYAAALEKLGVPEAERAAQADAFRQQWLRVNPTDVALTLIDETILAPAVKAIDEKFEDQPIVDAQLRQALADRYRELGRYDAAGPLQTSTLDTRRRVLGEEHPDTLASINNMGVLFLAQGRPVDAEKYLRAAFDRRRSVLGEANPATLRSQANLASALRRLSRFAESEQHSRSVLESRRRVLAKDHVDICDSLNNLGYLLIDLGRTKEAVGLFDDAASGYRASLGDNDSRTIKAIGNVAYASELAGSYGDAEVLYQQNLDLARSVFGEEHPITIQTLHDMGRLLRKQRRYDKAAHYLEAALASSTRAHGEYSDITNSIVSSLGIVYATIGKFDKALPYFEKALRVSRATYGGDHANTYTAVENLAELYSDMGRYSDAEALYVQVFTGRRRLLGLDHQQTLESARALCELLLKNQRFTVAESLLHELDTAIGERKNADHAKQNVYGSLLQLYEAWDRTTPGQGYDAKAAEWRAKLEAWQASTQPAASQPASSQPSATEPAATSP